MKFFNKLFNHPDMDLRRSARSAFIDGKQVFPIWHPVQHKDGYLIFEKYPFEPSIAFSKKIIPITFVENIDLNHAPPTLQAGREIIGISMQQKDFLKSLAENENIPLVQRPFIWNFILEPFLDTEYTAENDMRIKTYLCKYGISEEEIEAWRTELSSQMNAYNFDTMLWEWSDLTIFDALAAMRPKYSRIQFRRLYVVMMEMALLKPIDPS